MLKLDSKLAVIEGKWSDRTNISVKGLFDILSDINFKTPHAYVYEMFCNSASLKNIVSRMGRNPSIRYLYIGAHGSDNAIGCSGGKVTRRQLKHALSALNAGAVEGLFLGSCLFGHEENGDFLLNPPNSQNPPIKWVAGYNKSIDWIDSSVLDLLFWNKFFESDATTPVERIEATGKAIKKLAPGLIKELGFSVYKRARGPGGGIRSLLE
jgi:hypothetical protein